MRTLIKKLLLILCLCSASQAVNDFSGDTNCIALYRFENGALTTDSKGTDTLTASGSPVADTVNYVQGLASLDLEYNTSDYLYRTDADLSASFPFKNGGTTLSYSVTGWFRFESRTTAAYNGLFSKGSFRALYYTGTKYMYIGLPFVSGSFAFTHTTDATGLIDANWYFIAVTFNYDTYGYRVHIYDGVADAVVGTDTTGTVPKVTYGEPLENVTNLDIGGIGDSTQRIDGRLDEWTFWNRVLSVAEIDAIRAGTYGAAPPAAGGQVIMIGEL